MKNVRANCEKPLTADKYEELLDDVRVVHMATSLKDFEKKLRVFKERWDQNATE